jgi:hypothetical protein
MTLKNVGLSALKRARRLHLKFVNFVIPQLCQTALNRLVGKIPEETTDPMFLLWKRQRQKSIQLCIGLDKLQFQQL